MHFSSLDDALWAASLIGHVALVIVLLVRRRVRDFPVFTSFVFFEAARTVGLFFVLRYGSKHGYFLSYWITGFADYAFQVALLLEVARDVLRPAGRWILQARTSFFAWGGVGLVLSAALAFQIGPPQARGLDLWDVRITIFTSLLTCELFLAMALVANRLSLQWRSHAVAIGQGLAVFSFVALVEEFGHVILGWDRQFAVFVHARMFVYLSVLVYWMAAFWREERRRAPFSAEMSASLVALRERVPYDLGSGKRPL